ncbi:MAG: hypothetical protein WCF78_01135 [archaeon]
MVKIDNYYKFVGASFGLAYFVGLTIALIYILLGASYPVPESFTSSLHLTSQIYFKTTYLDMSNTSFNLAVIPFSYLIEAVNYGFSHTILLTSSFLGQIKLLVQLLPLLFFFLSFIIFSTIGLKAFLYIIKSIVNYFLQKKDRFNKLDFKIFTKRDIIFFFIGIISLMVGTIFQLKLIKIMFIFLINFKSITFALILILYLILILISGYTIYNLGVDAYNRLNKK